MPEGGLRIGNVLVVPAGISSQEAINLCSNDMGVVPVRLGNSENGWGTGCHPTTRLCLEFLCEELQPGDTFLDYGTGRFASLHLTLHCHRLVTPPFEIVSASLSYSGVLAIAALRMGAASTVAVDVDAEVKSN
jgi:ribosomal protein L11 methyltransferase